MFSQIARKFEQMFQLLFEQINRYNMYFLEGSYQETAREMVDDKILMDNNKTPP